MKPYIPRGPYPCEEYYMPSPCMPPMYPGMAPTSPMMPTPPPMTQTYMPTMPNMPTMPPNMPIMPSMMSPMPNMDDMGEPNGMRCPRGTKPYIVREGDTLWQLAYKYETTVDMIMMVNPQIANPNIIFPGQVICLPHHSTCNGVMYTVLPGDTLYAIAVDYDVTVDDIIAANPQISNPNLIFPGQEICIPGVNVPQPIEYYVVKPTDTLTTILVQCKVALHTLKAANPEFNENNITPGLRLRYIPMPCEPPCPKAKQQIIPKGVNGLVQVAEHFVVSTNNLLKYNPNYPPCYFIEGHPICVPPQEPV